MVCEGSESDRERVVIQEECLNPQPIATPARVERSATERMAMATPTGPEFIVVAEDTRRVVRELRAQLGLSRATVEKRAKVGTDYIKRLELGRHPNVEAARLRRVLQVLQQAAERGKVSASLTARLARAVKAVAPPAKATAR